MEMSFCRSCGIILDGKIAQDNGNNFCQYCTDEKGNLKPKKIIQSGIAEWLKSYAPKDTKADFMKRAASYMNAMPAWAED